MIPSGASLSPIGAAEQSIAADRAHGDPAIWITRLPDAAILATARAVAAEGRRERPLWGIPFAVKDNIDVAGLPTTAACPGFSYVPTATAPAVQRLLDAGAVLVGKTNLDQFATGLVGVRSPYGVPRNVFDATRVPGGSSSGSGCAALMLLATLAGAGAAAQDYPRRTIRILEPLAAGSAVDEVTRIVADKMGDLLGQSLYIDNQPGAAGLIGMRSGARAAPDGYTILAVNDSVVTVLPNMRGDAGYDPRKDFAPITQMVRIHWALVSSPALLPVTTLRQFIAAAKDKPGSIDFASGGQGSPQQIAMELFMRAAGIKLMHVPFRGATPALNEVVAGHLPVMFTALPTPLPFIADHRLTILGTADLQRLPTLPDVPTIAEAGLPGFEFTAWGALLAPAGTPAPIVAKLNQAAVTALGDAVICKRLTDLGYEVVGGTPDQLKTLLAQDYGQKAELLRAANIHAD